MFQFVKFRLISYLNWCLSQYEGGGGGDPQGTVWTWGAQLTNSWCGHWTDGGEYAGGEYTGNDGYFGAGGASGADGAYLTVSYGEA